jgi:hypothetical protein
MPEHSRVSIFARVRPIPDPTPHYQVDPVSNRIEFYLEREGKGGYVRGSWNI